MKNIAWITLFSLIAFSIKGLQRSSPDQHARDILQLSQNKAASSHLENEVFDNKEVRHLATIQEALNKSKGSENSQSIGEIEK